MMIPVNSSSIREVGYVGYHLFVRFHTSDAIYAHYGVPYSVFLELMQAASIGSSIGAYYNTHIRGKYH